MPGVDAPAASRAEKNKAHERSHHRFTGETRHSRTQWFYGLFRALLGDQALLSPSSANIVRQDPVAFAHLHRVDASIGASEPHDFTVRFSAVRPRAIRQLTGLVDPPCHPLTSPDAAASTASRPASVTIAIRPSSGTRHRGI